MFNATWFYAVVGKRLLRDVRPAWSCQRDHAHVSSPGPVDHLTWGPCVALMGSPVASIVLFGVITLFYVVESSIFGGAETA